MLWLPVEPVGDIARVHEELDRMLAERFGIGRHAFDRTFRPHVSLFTRGAAADMETVRGRLAHEIAPSEIVFSKFVIGSSVAGDTVVEFGN
jgi:2'-5' RNA ligase